jgi:hypothetical protein
VSPRGDRLTAVLIRLFRGVIREEAHERLLRELHDRVLPRLDAHPGVISATLAVPLEGGTPHETCWSRRGAASTT